MIFNILRRYKVCIMLYALGALSLSTVLVLLYDISQTSYTDIAIAPDIDEDGRLTVPKLLTKYRYKNEIHSVTTSDGYILEMHRIIKSPKNYSSENRKIIFLMHGMFSSSADWILAGNDKGLAYLLSDLNYDVWMGNARGNRYSRQHTVISPDDKLFWNFSFHETGTYDLPAMIDYILEKTYQTHLSYIGYAHGATVFFVMGSQRPEYLNKISHMQALGPVVYLHRTRSRFLKVVVSGNIMGRSFEYLPHRDANYDFGGLICDKNLKTKLFCSAFIFNLCGTSRSQMNYTLLSIISGHVPAGSSSIQATHINQLIEKDRFGQLDYGTVSNLNKYRSDVPPEYNLRAISTPVAIHYSDNDIISHPDDINRLSDILPNVIGLYKPSNKYFNHADYLIAIDVRELLYEKVVRIIKIFA